MYKDLKRTCTAIVLLIKTFLSLRSCRRRRRCLLIAGFLIIIQRKTRVSQIFAKFILNNIKFAGLF